MLLWLSFILCTALIVYSGSKLSKYGDIIAEKTGLGRTWIGVVLMASVTSLPELVTGVSSVLFIGVPDIAAGDALGSCTFNMLILAMLDFFYKQVPLSSKARHGHILAAGFGIILLSIVAVGIYTAKDFRPLGWFGPYTILLIIVYFIAMRLIYFYEKKQIASFVKEVAQELRYMEIPAKDAVVYYAINALVVVAAAIFLPKIGKGIAEVTGLGESFVGNVFIAMSTSLPEVVVSIAAVRIASIDLATGNLLGSNIFNVFILAIDDLLYTKGPVLSSINPNQIITVFSGILMTAIVVIGLTYRAEKKRLLLAWDSMGIIAVYVFNILLLYGLR